MSRLNWVLRSLCGSSVDYRGEALNLNVVASLSDASFTYSGTDRPVFTGITLDIRAGTSIALLGRNGVGKTTLLRILVGELQPSSGSVSYSKNVGYVSQDTILDDDLTLLEHVALFQKATDVFKPRPERLIADASLDEYAQDRVGTLSGGLRRRIDLMLGQVGQPELMIMDEPTVGLDPQSKSAFWDSLRQRTPDCALVVTTQDLENLAAWFDTILVLHDGALHDLLSDCEDEVVSGWRVVVAGENDQTFSEFHAAVDHARTAEAAKAGSVLAIRRATIEERYVSLTGETIDTGHRRRTRSRLRS